MTTNERLRGSLATAQLRTADVAERTGVDPKTVERWITQARLPHRTHRVAVAKMLAVDEAYLWPEVLALPGTQSAASPSCWSCTRPEPRYRTRSGSSSSRRPTRR